MSNGESAARKHRGLKPAWQQGQSGNPAGRPRGSRNKLGEAFLADLHADWLVSGVEAIQRVCRERPHDSDAELIERIRELDRHVQPFLDCNGPGDKVN